MRNHQTTKTRASEALVHPGFSSLSLTGTMKTNPSLNVNEKILAGINLDSLAMSNAKLDGNCFKYNLPALNDLYSKAHLMPFTHYDIEGDYVLMSTSLNGRSIPHVENFKHFHLRRDAMRFEKYGYWPEELTLVKRQDVEIIQVPSISYHRNLPEWVYPILGEAIKGMSLEDSNLKLRELEKLYGVINMTVYISLAAVYIGPVGSSKKGGLICN